jgi:hypothetical protein
MAVSHHPRAVASAIALAFGLVGSAARADIISDEEAECRGRDENAACTANGVQGTCAKSKCSRNAFDGEKRTVEEVDCLLCRPGAQGKAAASKPEEQPPKPEPTPAKTDAPPTQPAEPAPPPSELVPTPAKAGPVPAAPAGTAAPGGDPPKTDPQKPGCMGTIDAPSPTTASLVLGAVLFGLARRRRGSGR